MTGRTAAEGRTDGRMDGRVDACPLHLRPWSMFTESTSITVAWQCDLCVTVPLVHGQCLWCCFYHHVRNVNWSI